MGVDTSQYVYVWEYSVRPDRVEQFEQAYGPNGTWIELFRRAHGYLRTELHRDRSSHLRYVTIDHWTSLSDWERFRSRFSSDFEDLDARCEAFTNAEREIGRFDPVR